MTKEELKSKLLESRRFIDMALASLENEDYQKLDVRVGQIEAKLGGAVAAIKEHRESKEALG